MALPVVFKESALIPTPTFAIPPVLADNTFTPFAKFCAVLKSKAPPEYGDPPKSNGSPVVFVVVVITDPPDAAAHEGTPEANVNTCPSVPLANAVPVPAVPP